MSNRESIDRGKLGTGCCLRLRDGRWRGDDRRGASRGASGEPISLISRVAAGTSGHCWDLFSARTFDSGPLAYLWGSNDCSCTVSACIVPI